MDEERPPGIKPITEHTDSVQDAADVDEGLPRHSKNFEPVAPNYHKTKRKFHPFLIIVILLLIAAGAIYWFLIRAQPVKATTKKSASNAQSAVSAPVSSTTHYDSANFNLGFDYPKSWKLNDESGSGKLTVASTPMELKTADKQNVTGQAVILMRDTTQPLNEFAKGSATAVQGSEKISYKKPTQTQRADTYISFVNYASSGDAGLDAIYVTGDAGYQKDQAVPSIDIAKIQPVIDVNFVRCSDSKCSGAGTPITLSSAAWNDVNFSKPIKSLLRSLAIQ